MHVKNMKINNYKKKKNNLYEITLQDGNKINLYDDTILKFSLLINKEFNEEKWQEIISFNNKIASYNIAIKYLNTKLRTEKEIRKKLKDYLESDINYTVNRLKDEGYLNNALYIKSFVNDSINLKMMGPKKILFSLKKLGFKDNEIEEYLDSFNEDIWLDKIDKYIDKKIKSNHNTSASILKHKIMQELINKGFSNNLILREISKYEFVDDKSIYEKEYQKIKNKLSKKYTGEELEFRIKVALNNKGFKINP